jgi:hypothetical protein
MMVNCRSLVLVGSVLWIASAAVNCGGDGARSFGGGTGGGAAGTGGASAGSGGSGGSAGTGGSTSTGGSTGSTGGAFGSGGITGSGGRAATGGAGAGSGGRVGTGGVVGSGGIGSGGIVGSGGFIGTGGIVGTGGAGGSLAATCDALATEYANEMPHAKACIIGFVPQCQTQVPAALGCGMSCVTYVQTATMLNATAASWQAANCASLIRACPQVLCLIAQPGNCAVTTGTTTASCQNGSIATTQ